MLTSRPQTPGQVQDPTGVGNDDFDDGLKKSEFGYPVLGLYKLKEPLKAARRETWTEEPVYGHAFRVSETRILLSRAWISLS